MDTGITNPTTAKRDKNVVGDKASRFSPEDKTKRRSQSGWMKPKPENKNIDFSLSKQTHTSLIFFFFLIREVEIFLESFFTFLMKHYLAISFFVSFIGVRKYFKVI